MRPGTGPQDPRRRRPDRRRAPRLRFPAHPFPGAQRRGKEGIACAAPETETAPGRRLGQRQRSCNRRGQGALAPAARGHANPVGRLHRGLPRAAEPGRDDHQGIAMNCQAHLYRGQDPKMITRRWFFQQCGVGLGAIALGQLLRENCWAATATPNPLAPKQPHFAAKAKRVIFLFMAGAPSHLELFDYKPALEKWNGKPPPEELIKGYRAAFINPNAALLGPKFKFAKHGQAGAELSELLPHLAGIVDDIAIVKSMHTDAFNHAPGQILMSTGTQQFGRPSVGSWTTYGLGSESQDLPAFVVFSTGAKGPSGGASNWGAGFLPSVYQGVLFRSVGDPVLYLSNPKGVDQTIQRDSLDAIKRLNQKHLDIVGDPEIATRINSFEMAYRMQSSAPELMDLSKEPKHILEMYGAEPGKPSFANNCLLARRLDNYSRTRDRKSTR